MPVPNLGSVRCICTICAVVVALSACGASAADSASSSTSAPRAANPCGPDHARTLGASAVARVYALNGAVYGCSAQTGKRIRLGQTTRCLGTPRVGPVAVAGKLTAYGLQSCGVDTGQGTVLVRRLTDGAMLQEGAATVGRLGPESYSSVAAIVVKGDGAVAWVGMGASIIHRGQLLEVHRLDRDGDRLLDHGAGIDPHSLRLRGSALSWRNGKRTRSATLR